MNVPLFAAEDLTPATALPFVISLFFRIRVYSFSIGYPFFNTLPAVLTDKPGDFIIPSFFFFNTFSSSPEFVCSACTLFYLAACSMPGAMGSPVDKAGQLRANFSRSLMS